MRKLVAITQVDPATSWWGPEAASRSVTERISGLYLQFRRGLVSQQELDQELDRGLLAEALQPVALRA
ncbi:MAG: hypothetical protein QOD77_1323 [Thermoplasmata archaeon]|nr:hypothetical protein [Thermoplasmata archaeon]